MLRAIGIGVTYGGDVGSSWVRVRYLSLPREGSRPAPIGNFVERRDHPGHPMRPEPMISVGWSVVSPQFPARVDAAVRTMISEAGIS
jgi:hypothetical protein